MTAEEKVIEAAKSLIETMPRRHSHIEGREVVSGFTVDSSKAAIALDDALAELHASKDTA